MDALLEAGTAVVADVFDSLGLVPPVLADSIAPIGPGARFVGPAYTIAGHAEASAATGDRAKLAAIDAMPAAAIAVWAGNDIRGVCCFGDLLAEAMRARGCAGVVVDGGVRDVGYLRTLEMPIVARYRTPAQAIGRWKVTGQQQPVQVRGGLSDWVTVRPGDTVVADEDGVIVVAQDLVAEVTDRVTAWSGVEQDSRAAIQAGMPLLAALDKFGHL